MGHRHPGRAQAGCCRRAARGGRAQMQSVTRTYIKVHFVIQNKHYAKLDKYELLNQFTALNFVQTQTEKKTHNSQSQISTSQNSQLVKHKLINRFNKFVKDQIPYGPQYGHLTTTLHNRR